MKRFLTGLAEPQLDELKRISEETQISIAEHIRRAIDDYLEKLRRRKAQKVK